MKAMDVRPYTIADRDSCLAVFDSQSPDGWDRAELDRFLTGPPGPYFVLEHGTAVVGCGGYNIDGSTARLAWGMIHRDFERQGLGRYLLMYRLRQIGNHGAVQVVSVVAPMPAVGFFEKQGFRQLEGRDNGVELVKRLVVCT